MPEKFKNLNKELLLNLIEIFYSDTGMYINYDSIAKKLRIGKKTLIEHIFYLEFSYLLRRIRNFRPKIFTTTRKMQRVYANWWALAYCYTDSYDKIMKNLVASILDAKYYWRKSGKEIDFLIVDKKRITPIEIKNKTELTSNDLKNMKYFLEKYSTKKDLLFIMVKKMKLK